MGEDDTGRELSWGRVGVGSGFVWGGMGDEGERVDRDRDRQTDRQRDRQTDRQIDR